MNEARSPTPRPVVEAKYELRYSKVDVFERPDVDSPTLAQLMPGDEFEVASAGARRGTDYDFCQVRLADGREGFVFAANLRGVPPAPAAKGPDRDGEGSDAVQVETLPLTPAMRTHLTNCVRGQRRVQDWLIRAIPATAVITILLAAFAVPAGMASQTVVGIAVCVLLFMGAMWFFGQYKTEMLDEPDLRAGVYFRVTGPIVLETDHRPEVSQDTLVAGGRRFSVPANFDRLREGLRARRVIVTPKGIDEFSGRGVVSYLAQSGTVLEVRNEAGDILYQYRLYLYFGQSE